MPSIQNEQSAPLPGVTESGTHPCEAEPSAQLTVATTDAVLTTRMWWLLLLTGVGAGLTSGLLMKLLRLAQHLSFDYSHGDFLTAVQAVTPLHRVFILSLAGVFTVAALAILRRIPTHSPSDLNDAIREHNGRLDGSPTAIRAVLSIVIVGMGAAVGREQALKQAGALLACKLSDWSRLSPPQQKLLVACGAGAGMAAAYNVPFGGALFAVEVLLGTLSFSTVLPALVVSVIATLVSWSMLPNTPTYRTPTLPPTHSLIAWAFLAGPLMGLASIAFVRIIHWGRKHAAGKWPVVFLPIPVFAALGFGAIWFPQLLGNGRNVIQLVFDSRLAVPLLCWLLILRPIATALCFRAGAPGGVFTPTMTFGALVGAVLGQIWSYLAPATDKRSYAILGAGAVLSAATQAPLSSIAFILELTYNGQTLIVPLLIAVAGATLTFRQLEPNAMY